MDQMLIENNKTTFDLNDNKYDKDLVKIIEEQLNNDDWIPNRTTLYILIIIYSLMIIVAFLLNIVILLTVLLSKNLRKPNILLSLNLIIANILTSSICMPFTVNSIIFKFWTFNELLCKFIPFIQSVTVFVISTTVTFISIDRYFMITSLKKDNSKFFKSISKMSNKELKIFANFIIWLLAFILSSPILFYQQLVSIGIKDVYVKKVCIEQYPYRIRIVYAILTFTIAFIIPLLTLSYFHYKIKCFLNKHIRKFDLSRDKIMTNSTGIKTISSQNQQSLFINLNKRNSDANYYSLIDLNLFNSSDSHSSPNQTRDFLNSIELDKTKLSMKLNNSRKKLNKSLTLGNNFEFHTFLSVYQMKSKNSTDKNLVNKLKNSKNLSTDCVILDMSKTKLPNQSLSLNQLNQLNEFKSSTSLKRPSLTINNSSAIDSSNVNNSSNKFLTRKVKHNLSFKDNQFLNDQKRKQLNKKIYRRNNSLNYALFYRSLSDSNLFDLSQPIHNSFLHELNPYSNTNMDQMNSHTSPQSNLHISPSFSSQGINLDYLKLVNFDYNQRTNTIIPITNSKNNQLTNSKRSEQIKIASFARLTFFLNRIKRFQYLNRELQRNQKITFILISGILIFGISWLPLNVYNLYFDFNYDNIDLNVKKVYFIFSICHILAMSSAISNAILYGLLNTNIQKELIKFLKNCIYTKS